MMDTSQFHLCDETPRERFRNMDEAGEFFVPQAQRNGGKKSLAKSRFKVLKYS